MDDTVSLSSVIDTIDFLYAFVNEIRNDVKDLPPLTLSDAMDKFNPDSFPDTSAFRKNGTTLPLGLLFLLGRCMEQSPGSLYKILTYVSEFGPIPEDFDRDEFAGLLKLASPEKLLELGSLTMPTNISKTEQKEIFYSLEKRVEYMDKQAKDIIKCLNEKNINKNDRLPCIVTISEIIFTMQAVAKQLESCMGETHITLLSSLVGMTEHLCLLLFDIMYDKSAKKGVNAIVVDKNKRDYAFGTKAERNENFKDIQTILNETYYLNPDLKSFEAIYKTAVKNNRGMFLKPGINRRKRSYDFETIKKHCRNPRTIKDI